MHLVYIYRILLSKGLRDWRRIERDIARRKFAENETDEKSCVAKSHGNDNKWTPDT
jgi:hypothetical protein